MIRHAKASSARSNPRESSNQGSSPPSGRLRLTILLTAIAAFLLVPAAQALAASEATVNVAGTGSGTVTGGYEFFNPETEEEVTAFTGTPPINCSGPPKTGSCIASITATNPFEEFLLEIFESEGGGGIGLTHTATPGSAFAGWTIVGGTPLSACEASEPHCLIVTAEGESTEVTATFNKAFTVEKVGGEGTVTGKESGMVCGPSEASCSVEYTGKETLTASPAAGYAFSKWKGCTVAAGLKCTIETVTPSTKIIAYFIPTSSLKVTKAGSGAGSVKATGISCDESCSEAKSAIATGKVVKITTKPAKGSKAAVIEGGTGSAGGCSGESCEFTIEAGSSVTVKFDPIPSKTLTVNLTGPGAYKGKVSGKGVAKNLIASKISCGMGCTTQTESFLETDTVTLEALPVLNYTFVGWSGAGCSGTGTCVVATSSNKTVNAEFE